MSKVKACVVLAIFGLFQGCAFSPVRRPDPLLYKDSFVGSRVIPLPYERTLEACNSAAESIGFKIHSLSKEAGVVRTVPRPAQIPEVCDCGTWNMDPVRGWGEAALVATVREQGPGKSVVTLDNECGTNFTGRNLYGIVTRQEAYRCASRGHLEKTFWDMLDQILARTRPAAATTPPRGTSGAQATLELVDAHCRFEASQVVAEGLVKNTGTASLEAVGVVVMLYDEAGGYVGSEEGEILIKPLGPGQASPFKISASRPAGLKCEFAVKDRSGTQLPTDGAGSGELETEPTTGEAATGIVMTPVPPPSVVVTLAKFSAVASGMSYGDVARYLGGPGKIIRTSQEGSDVYILYTWVNSDGSRMSGSFRNGIMTSKAQSGLR